MKKSFWLIIALACVGSICLFFYVADLCNNAEDNIKPSKLPEGIFDTENTTEKQHELEEQQKNYDTWGIERIWEIGFGYNENATQDDIDHIGKLIHLKRLEISIGESEIDLSPLGNLVELESLDIFIQYGCSPDLSFVEKLSKLEKLDISVGSEVVDLSPLGSLSKLRQLTMAAYGVDVNDLSFLRKLNRLEEVIFIKICTIEDLSLFQNMPYLRELNIEYVGDCDLNYLADLKNLETLVITGENIRNPEGLSNLTHLKLLSLCDNSSDAMYGNTEREPFDLQPFANLKKLEWLDLAYVIIEDISPLAELKKIREINLVDTNVRDISSLMSLDNLDVLYLFGNSSELVKEQAETFFHEIKHMIVTEEIPYDYRYSKRHNYFYFAQKP